MRIERPDLADVDWPIPADALSLPGDTVGRSSAISGGFFAKRDDASGPLDIIGCPENASPTQRWRSRLPPRRAAILIGIGGIGLLLQSSAGPIQFNDPGPLRASIARSGGASAPAIDLPPPDLLRPLSPDEAAKENAARPFVNRADTPARSFVLRTDAEDRDRALTCLAQAVYYEAAGEGVDGGRAVAQVVLNRVRHPGYPASVCGVVYQGSDRTTGCQFTFTCDGLLLQAPIASLWARSRKIAQEALAGGVFAPVGHATHYHADYVLPYWADSLDKTVQIGRHIFYRLRSFLGDGRAFSQRYAGAEPQVPQPGSTVVIPPSAITEQLASALISDGLNGAARDVEKVVRPVSPLAIDSSRGTLVADEQAPPVQSQRPHSSGECATAGDRKQLAPLGANDMRSGIAASGC